MVIEIREVCQQDKAQWLQLWEGYTRFYGSPQPSDVTEYTWQRMLDSASPMLGRVALADGNIAGFAICVLHEGTWVKTPVCYLEDLFVDEAARGKGAGRALIEGIIDEARQKAWSKVYWVTRTGNPARALYDQLAAVDDYVRYRITI